MNNSSENFDHKRVGQGMSQLLPNLFPICRSITGDGVRDTLRILQQVIPLEIHEVPTGTPVLDWQIPPEWNISQAFISDANNRRIVDFHNNNLHVLGYSIPVTNTLALEELREHVHSLPDRPALVPYRTSYYKEDWGFCISEDQLGSLADGRYEVVIDSRLSAGSLSYGEFVLKGETEEEVLFSTHVCHPSMANDNLSGMLVAAYLGRLLSEQGRLRYTYRFVFVPGTIGSITWLARNEQAAGRVKHGLVLAGLGDDGPFTYKRSRIGSAEIDLVAEYVLGDEGGSSIIDFSPYGYDERQYCSPGFNLPVGSLSRTPFGTYPEYHTSGDNLDFITVDALVDALRVCLRMVEHLEGNSIYVNLSPFGEPQLGRRGLYESIGGRSDKNELQNALLWVLNQSDGGASLLEIARKSGLPFPLVREAARLLETKELLRESRPVR